MAEELLVHAECDAFIAGTGCDADRTRANVQKLGMNPVTHSNRSRKRHLPLDRTLYRRIRTADDVLRGIAELSSSGHPSTRADTT